jgi:peptide/nickel transport system substrate-binding protein
MYEDINRKLMEFLPGVPYAHSKPAMAFRADVQGYVPSPVSLEPFALVSMNAEG